MLAKLQNGVRKLKKKTISFIIAVVIFLNMSIAYGAEGIDGKFSGTYKMTKIYINNINEALKDLNLPISYSDDPEDYDAYPFVIRLFKDNRATLIFDDFNVGSKKVTINGNKIFIEFYDGYYGYTDELNVRYTLEGVIEGNKISGTFVGVITQTGKLESEGTFEIKSGFSFDLFGSNDDDEAKDETEEPETVEEYVQVTDLLFDTVSKEINVGHEEKLKATIFPSNASNKAVSYTSSDPKVVRVSQAGKIVAQKAGDASITVSSEDNPNEFDEMHIIVYPNIDDVLEEDLEKIEHGMAIFDETEEQPEDENFTVFGLNDLTPESKERGENTVQQLIEITEKNPDIQVVDYKQTENENTQEKNFDQFPGVELSNASAQEKIDQTEYDTQDEFIQDVKETMRKVKKPAKKIVDGLIDKIPKVAGIDIFHEYVKDKFDESVAGLGDKRKKTDDEIKEQLQKNLSADNEHFALKYLKDKAESNSFVKIFAYPINKIFGAKKEYFKEAAFTEYKSVRDKIKKDIQSGMTKEEAIKRAKNDFVYNDNYDTTFDAIENAKPGLQRFFAMRQGGKENQVITGSKKEFQSNDKRFEKYLEFFGKNLEFEGVE